MNSNGFFTNNLITTFALSKFSQNTAGINGKISIRKNELKEDSLELSMRSGFKQPENPSFMGTLSKMISFKGGDNDFSIDELKREFAEFPGDNNGCRYNEDDFKEIAKVATKDNIKFIKELSGVRDYRGWYRFNRGDITSIKEFNESSIEFAREILNFKTDEGKESFQAYEIARMVNGVTKDNAKYAIEITREILGVKHSDSADVPNKYYIPDLLKVITDDNIGIVRELLAIKNPKGRHRFATLDIANLTKITDAENIKFIKKLTELNDGKHYRFVGSDIVNIVKVATEENTEYIMELSKLKDSKDEYKFNGKAIAVLVGLNEDERSKIGNILQNSDIGSDKIDGIVAYAKLDKDQTEVFDRVREQAFIRRDQLKSGIEDLTDKNIDDFFYGIVPDIINTADLIGESAFLSAYMTKLNGLKDLTNNCSTLKRKLSKEDFEKVVELFNPTRSSKYKELHTLEKELRVETKKIAEKYKTRFENASSKEEKLQLSAKQKAEMAALGNPRAQMQEMKKTAGQIDPKTKIQRTKVLNAVSNDDDLGKFINLLSADNKAWTKAVNRKVFEFIDVAYSDDLSARLNFASNEYLPQILSSRHKFKDGLKEIVELMAQNPKKNVGEILDTLAQNTKTREMFEKMGIDYDKWTKADKNSFVSVKIKTNEEMAKKAAISNLEEDFNDSAFELLYKEQRGQIDSLFKKLEEKEIVLKKLEEMTYDEDGVATGTRHKFRLYYQGKPLRFEELSVAINAIKEEVNKDENKFWNAQKSDFNNEAVYEAKETIREHLVKLRYNDMKRASAIKGDEESEVEVHKTDMNNIAHALFLGNHGACCTAVGGGINEWSAPAYIKNKCIQAIELMDGKEFVGNTMCFIAKVDDTPSLILDNIELKTKYQYNDNIKDAIFAYAKKFTEDIGQPDMPIYLGPNRHKIKTEDLESATHNVSVIGSTGGEEVYFDYVTDGRIADSEETDSVKLFKVSL